jgi:hypothetical protein
MRGVMLDKWYGRTVPAFVALMVVTADAASASGPIIHHEGVGCVAAERYPHFQAAFEPSDGVSRARVFFRTEPTKAWYAIAMKSDGSAFVGTLPRPRKSLKAFDYYIEVVDREFGVNRTAEYRADVVSSPAACQQGRVMAGAAGSAAVTIEAPAGAPAVPAGFSPAGVTTAASTTAAAGGAAAGGGGGLSGTTLGIIGGAAAAGGAVAVVAASNKSSTPEATPPPPPPSVSGTWRGNESFVISASSYTCPEVAETVTWTLNQSGNSISGTEDYVTTSSPGVCTDGGSTPDPGSGGAHTLTGTLEGTTVTLTYNTCTLSGTLSGNVMSGQITRGNYPFDPTRRVSGSWNVTR